MKECLLFKSKMCSATFWLLCSQQLSSVSLAADLHFGVFKIKSDDGCSWRASLIKDFYHRNLFWVDASPLSLRSQPLHVAHVYRRVFFECVSTSAQTPNAVDKHLHRQTAACPPVCLRYRPPPLWLTVRGIGSIRHSLFVCIIPCVYAAFIAPRSCVTTCRAYCHCTLIHDSQSHVVSTDAHTENLFAVTGQQCICLVYTLKNKRLFTLQDGYRYT